MDDPWGSPWASATSDTISKNNPSPSPPKPLLSLPPKAFFGSNTNSPAQSPWVEHNGFGEWASPSQIENPTATASWGLWSEPGLTPRPEPPGKQSPIAWPSSAAASPSLKPTSRSRASSLFRQPSPDSWTTESPWTERRGTLSSVPDRDAPSRFEDGGGAKTDVVIHVQEPMTLEDKGGDRDETSTQNPDTERLETAAAGSSPKVASGLTAEAEGYDSPSRPSSTFSIESSQGLDRQDSPITSIDEDPISRPLQLARKTSRNVSELVGLYDGLARDTSEEPPVPEKYGLGPVSQKASASHSGALYGRNAPGSDDWDDATDIASEVSRGSTSSPSSGRSSTPKVKVEADPRQRLSMESGGHGSLPPLAASLAIRELVVKFGDIRFEPDLKLLDQVVAKLPQVDQVDDHTQDDLSDRIITDSFSTVGERKAWYRISRYGSMRKHNSGDEENYHSVSWPTSRLHHDTIKIIRRWMEEDSVSGKPMLGGSKRTSAFNWDSSAAPVSLDKVFARRSLASTPKSVSVATFGHTPKSSIGSLGSVLEERKSFQGPVSSNVLSSTASVSALPVAGFAWSSFPPPASAEAAGLVLQETKANTVTRKATTPTSPPLMPPTAVSHPRPSHTVDKNFNRRTNENNEWDDMVFSPTQETFTTSNEVDCSDISSATGSATLRPANALQINELPSTVESPARDFETPQVDTCTLSGGPASQTLGMANPTPPNRLSTDPWASIGFPNFGVPAKITTPFTASSLPDVEPLSLSEPQGGIAGIVDALHLGMLSDIEPSVTAVTLGPIEISKNEVENDIVQRILQSLPDLSYMLP